MRKLESLWITITGALVMCAVISFFVHLQDMLNDPTQWNELFSTAFAVTGFVMAIIYVFVLIGTVGYIADEFNHEDREMYGTLLIIFYSVPVGLWTLSLILEIALNEPLCSFTKFMAPTLIIPIITALAYTVPLGISWLLGLNEGSLKSMQLQDKILTPRNFVKRIKKLYIIRYLYISLTIAMALNYSVNVLKWASESKAFFWGVICLIIVIGIYMIRLTAINYWHRLDAKDKE